MPDLYKSPTFRCVLHQSASGHRHGRPLGANVSWIETPAADHGLYRIRMRAPGDPSARFPHSFVWIDPASGGVLAIIDARHADPNDILLNWIHPLHDSPVRGLAARWIAVFAGLEPTFLLVLPIGPGRHALALGARRAQIGRPYRPSITVVGKAPMTTAALLRQGRIGERGVLVALALLALALKVVAPDLLSFEAVEFVVLDAARQACSSRRSISAPIQNANPWASSLKDP